MLDGAARKIGLVLAGLSFIPWVVVVVGFGLATQGNSAALQASANFPYWVISLGGLPLIGLGTVHAIVSSPTASKIIGVFTTFMSILYAMSLGMTLYVTGIVLVAGITTSIPIILLFAGSLLGALMLTPLMMLWGCYAGPPPEGSGYNGGQETELKTI